MSWNNILVEKDGPVAILTINRPQVLNALNAETLTEIDGAIKELGADPAVRVIIITGAGEKAFVAGADIAFMSKLTPLEAKDFARLGQKVLSKIENLPKPVIAAVNGFALGGGCELAMACDIRVASEKAKFGQPEVNLGLIAGFGGTQRLTRLVNPGLAKEILFTADMFDAETARRIGLVNHVVPAEELLNFCRGMAERIAARGPVAVRLTKEAVNEGLEMDLEKALAHEADLFGLVFATADREEGITAFLNKRKPQFQGR
ncbi:enoyl-CoA hydratase-related protein [Desulfofundulus thermosubterraneus]|uniref:short-chain-enoyl-CoA hydratase n=1 Tax=Desulfofundulus thermosubterraneus DSM 16057 TaxID=1121432 RepID=A0A1M6KEN0_9FIRM|nr:enoyl-CoA hydratase-related protein [Desulfofundulus thermosubterraneus]SHJ57404.1 enoyl-CoA hydratase [Desulfofundulus thermosubterraneus DSM 16057]